VQAHFGESFAGLEMEVVDDVVALLGDEPRWERRLLGAERRGGEKERGDNAIDGSLQ